MAGRADPLVAYIRRSLAIVGVILVGVAMLTGALLLYQSTLPGPGYCQAVGQSCPPASVAPSEGVWVLVAAALAIICAGAWGLLEVRRRYAGVNVRQVESG
jgi:hypothetical protein